MRVGKCNYKRGGREKSFFVCTAKNEILSRSVKPLELQKYLMELKPDMCISYDSAIPLSGYTK